MSELALQRLQVVDSHAFSQRLAKYCNRKDLDVRDLIAELEAILGPKATPAMMRDCVYAFVQNLYYQLRADKALKQWQKDRTAMRQSPTRVSVI